ncbi:sugar diacid recognition domain-containing protein [Bacillus sp. MUM 13]|uniref:CdaR family transcriptional regulator n=1 Tax=Bacillus sp. MUM 13 TaxID=1678001 RepID=UPI0008F5EE35|nr:sugar diacid recognition domain-containing protein [Bacillus sp. MUM 13]OIK12155.1 CdaR family transcriptional regulator [Bacillus sp. MUM 13]
MFLIPELSTKIVREVQQVLSGDIIVVDTKGEIIASTQHERIGNFHEGAQLVLRSKEKLYINQTMTNKLKGVKAGINMPIILDEKVIGVIGVTGDPKEVEPYAELIRRMTELIIKEAFYAEQLEWKTKGLESFFHEWVNLKIVDEEFLERGKLMGISMNVNHFCCMLQIPKSVFQKNEGHILQRNIFELSQEFFQRKDDYIIRWGEGRYLLLKSVSPTYNRGWFTRQLKEFKRVFEHRYRCNISIGVGKTYDGKVIHRSYIEAKKAQKVAQKTGGLVFYEDLVIDVILEEIPRDMQHEFLERTVGILLEQPELIETLEWYISNNQSVKETALKLHLHINTLYYRLKQIKELTGIDPKETDGIVLFYIALRFLKDLHRESLSLLGG